MAQVIHKEEFIFTPENDKEFPAINYLVDRMANTMKEKGYLVKKDTTTLTITLHGKMVFNTEDKDVTDNL